MFDSDELVAILDHLSTPVAVYAGDDLVIRFANEPMLAIWGRDGGVIGSPLTAGLPGGDSDPVIAQLTGLLRSGTDGEAGESMHRFYRDGELKWLSCSHQYKTLDQGPEQKILHIINSTRAGYPGQRPDEQGIRVNAGGGGFRNPGQEASQDLISRFIAQVPAGICILGGPDMVFELANPFYQQLFPGRQLLGRPLALAVPEIKDGPLFDILQDVYRTGRTFQGRELLFPLRNAAGQSEDRYFTFIYQARRAADNAIDGIFVFVMDVTEAVLGRIRAQEQEMRLREMVMASHYGMMILQGGDMVIQVANQQIANLWRKRLDEIIGKKLIEVLPEIKDQPFPELLARVYETGVSYGQPEEVLYLQSPDGDLKRHVSFYYDPLLDSSGQVSSILVSCEDITEKVESRGLLEAGHRQQQALNQELASVNRRLEAVNQEMLATNIELIQTQKRLQDSISVYEKSEHLMHSIVSNAPFPIGVYQGREMLVVMVNKALTDVWGKGENVVGKRYAEVLPELEDQHVFEQLDKVFTSGVPLHLRNQRIDLMVEGRMKAFYFNYSFTPLFDKDGEIYGVMNTAADVTDLYMAKQNLERSEQNLHNIILQAPVAMSILSGPEHIISVANNKMIELWGKPADAVMNKPVFEALPEAKDQGLEEHMENVYLGGETFQANEMPVTLIRNGMHEVVYQDFVYQPYRNAEGEIVGVIAITIDVTAHVLARKKIEESESELRMTQKRLEEELQAGRELQRQRDVFFGIASHELKTPLTSLTAIIQVAQAKLRNSSDPFLTGAMNTANVQLKRMSSMVNSFLNISQLEGGTIVLRKEPLQLRELVAQVIDEIRFAAGTHEIRYRPVGDVIVFADRDKLSSVVTNLIHNAIKYSPDANVVEVGCLVSGGDVVVRVRDFGFGIEPDDVPRIFDRYYRVRGDKMQHISGFGIGLYLCAEIIERHGGRIGVDSEPGKGSEFYFSLPVAV